MGKMIYLRNVVSLALDQTRCVRCGMCLVVCPHAVFGMSNGKAEIANRDACMECGACARNCPTDAITVHSGVGCASAVINAALGRNKASCCSIADSEDAARCEL